MSKKCNETCEHFIYIGEGEFICDKTMPPKFVLEDWQPTQHYFWCQFKKRINRLSLKIKEQYQ